MKNSDFAVIYKQYYSVVLDHIKFKINGDIMIAEELTDDVFIKVSEHLKIFNPDRASIKTWILTIARNIVIDYYRKVKEQTISINGFVNSEGHETIQIHSTLKASNKIEGQELGSAINTAMNQLTGKQKEIAELYFMHNKKYVEIAQVLDIPLGSVKATLLRAKESLQYLLRNVYQTEMA